ncbi:MAG: lysophospholipase [Chloroflexi bacterium]|nr:lysophospholipase [Chloroflexota bacterium]
MQSHDLLTTGPHFSRHLISYPSDGLTIYGFMNRHPATTCCRWPWCCMVTWNQKHMRWKHIPCPTPTNWQRWLPGHSPQLPQLPPSDAGDNLFRIGYAIDVLNLIAIIKNSRRDNPGPLQHADPNRIFLFGHSMGGGIALVC